MVVASEAGSHLPNKVALRRIEVRGERDNRFFVRGELNAGDRIADEGAFKLRDSLLVDIQAAARG